MTRRTLDEDLRIGLGTYQLTGSRECTQTVVRALERGYRHIDTAQMYGNEAAVGEGIKRASVPREEVFVATKIHPDNLGYDDVLESAATSIERLSLNRLDLLYVHWPLGAYEPDETLRAFNELLARGDIDHVGLSNFTPELLDEALSLLAQPPLAHQVELHPFLQQTQLREYARRHEFTVVGYCPLARGAVLNDPVLVEIGEKHGVSPARVTLAWHLSKQQVAAVPKARGEHLRDNLAAHSLELDQEDIKRIDALNRGQRHVDDTPGEPPWT